MQSCETLDNEMSVLKPLQTLFPSVPKNGQNADRPEPFTAQQDSGL
jgi:hypothetical protein